MEQATPAVRDLARLLLVLEANQSEHAVGGEAQVVLNAFDKLRLHLSKFVGVAGFQALLARALALAKTEADWLAAVRVKTDATLEGFRETAQQQPAEVVAAGSVVLLALLLGLLVTFIGEALTLRLVGDVWQEASSSARSRARSKMSKPVNSTYTCSGLTGSTTEDFTASAFQTICIAVS